MLLEPAQTEIDLFTSFLLLSLCFKLVVKLYWSINLLNLKIIVLSQKDVYLTSAHSTLQWLHQRRRNKKIYIFRLNRITININFQQRTYSMLHEPSLINPFFSVFAVWHLWFICSSTCREVIWTGGVLVGTGRGVMALWDCDWAWMCARVCWGIMSSCPLSLRTKTMPARCAHETA